MNNTTRYRLIPSTDRLIQMDTDYYSYTKLGPLYKRLGREKNMWALGAELRRFAQHLLSAPRHSLVPDPGPPSPYCDNCRKRVPTYAPILGIPVTENVLFELAESDVVKSLLAKDWSLLDTAERICDWNFQPALLIGLGRCEVCDGPFSVLGEVHGETSSGTLPLKPVFLMEIEKKSGLELLEKAIGRNLMANEKMYARAVAFCKILGSTKDFPELSLARRKEQAQKFGNLGMTYLARGRLDKAEAKLTIALRLAEELNDAEYQVTSYYNLATVAYQRRKLDHAETLLTKSLQLFEQFDGRRDVLASVYQDLGIINFDRKEYERAEPLLCKALEMLTTIGNMPRMAIGYERLGILHKTQNRRERARDMYTQALMLYKVVGERKDEERTKAELDRLED